MQMMHFQHIHPRGEELTVVYIEIHLPRPQCYFSNGLMAHRAGDCKSSSAHGADTNAPLYAHVDALTVYRAATAL